MQCCISLAQLRCFTWAKAQLLLSQDSVLHSRMSAGCMKTGRTPVSDMEVVFFSLARKSTLIGEYENIL